MPEPAALSTRTRAAYAADWRHWAEWCRARAVAPTPVEPSRVRSYIEDLWSQTEPDGAPRFRASTIKRRVAALAHYAPGAGTPDALTQHEEVAPVLAAIRDDTRLSGRPRPQITDEILLAVIEAMSHHTWPGGVGASRDSFLFLLGRAGRLSRYQAPDLRVADVALDATTLHLAAPEEQRLSPAEDPRLCVSCSAVRWIAHLRVAERAAWRSGGMRLVIETGRPHTWTHVCDAPLDTPGSPSAPLFRRITRAGRIGTSTMGSGSLNAILKNRLVDAGLDARPYGFASLSAGERPRGGASP